MALPSSNAVGGALAIIAFGAVLYFGLHEKRPVVVPAPTAPVAAPAKPVPAPVEKTPAPAVVKVPAPVAPCTVEHPCHTVVPITPPGAKKPVYHKVLKGGKVDGAIDCTKVPAVAKTFTPQQIQDAAKQYGLPPATVNALLVCLK